MGAASKDNALPSAEDKQPGASNASLNASKSTIKAQQAAAGAC